MVRMFYSGVFPQILFRTGPLTDLCFIRLGVKTRVFHLGDYRRATLGPGQDVPDDYFFVNGESTFRPGRCEIEVEAFDDGTLGPTHGANGSTSTTMPLRTE